MTILQSGKGIQGFRPYFIGDNILPSSVTIRVTFSNIMGSNEVMIVTNCKVRTMLFFQVGPGYSTEMEENQGDFNKIRELRKKSRSRSFWDKDFMLLEERVLKNNNIKNPLIFENVVDLDKAYSDRMEQYSHVLHKDWDILKCSFVSELSILENDRYVPIKRAEKSIDIILPNAYE